MANHNEHEDSRRPVDRTRGVDRTQGAEHTAPYGVDRTQGVDRTVSRSADRTEPRSVDRTRHVDRSGSRSVDRTLGGGRVPPKETDYFPGLHVGADEVELTSHVPVEPHPDTAADQAFEPVQPAEDLPDMTEVFGEPLAESRDLFSDSHGHVPFYSTDDGVENLSSSAAPPPIPDDRADPKKAARKRLLRRVGKGALTAFLIMVIVGCIVVSSFAVYVFGFVDDSFDYNLYDLTLDYTTTIYAKDPTYSPQKEGDP